MAACEGSTVLYCTVAATSNPAARESVEQKGPWPQYLRKRLPDRASRLPTPDSRLQSPLWRLLRPGGQGPGITRYIE
jgi:ABC-type antimicrobial peptide transport system ATPase subunit